ncbi:MAG: DUF4145 domain-containing protein [Verrucomicrobia bacterium]|nr:DUF4145 domain-containing protein [Verrucomicrobiota bacterium]
MFDLTPASIQKPPIEEHVARISPTFVKIYSQAIAAESHKLDEIAGVGLRKALEFLIKDYCIYKHPNKAADIKSTALGNCIKHFVADTNIKQCSERATWLGNDETHYVRVWDLHDINDLKVLIKLTHNWISNELLTERYLKEMQSKSGAVSTQQGP